MYFGIPGHRRFFNPAHRHTELAVEQDPVADLGGDRYPNTVIGYNICIGVLISALIGHPEVQDIALAAERLREKVGSCLVDVSRHRRLLVKSGAFVYKGPLGQQKQGIALFNGRVLQPVFQL